MIDHAALRKQLAPHIAALTQSEVARRSGIAQPDISAWINGRRPMPLERVIRLAQAVGGRPEVRLRLPSRTAAGGGASGGKRGLTAPGHRPV